MLGRQRRGQEEDEDASGEQHLRVRHDRHTLISNAAVVRDLPDGATITASTIARWDDKSADKRSFRTHQKDNISASTMKGIPSIPLQLPPEMIPETPLVLPTEWHAEAMTGRARRMHVSEKNKRARRTKTQVDIDHDGRTLSSIAAAVSRVGAHGKAAVVARVGARAAVAAARDRAGACGGGSEARVEVGHPVETVHDVRAARSRQAGGRVGAIGAVAALDVLALVIAIAASIQ